MYAPFHFIAPVKQLLMWLKSRVGSKRDTINNLLTPKMKGTFFPRLMPCDSHSWWKSVGCCTVTRLISLVETEVFSWVSNNSEFWQCHRVQPLDFNLMGKLLVWPLLEIVSGGLAFSVEFQISGSNSSFFGIFDWFGVREAKVGPIACWDFKQSSSKCWLLNGSINIFI